MRRQTFGDHELADIVKKCGKGASRNPWGISGHAGADACGELRVAVKVFDVLPGDVFVGSERAKHGDAEHEILKYADSEASDRGFHVGGSIQRKGRPGIVGDHPAEFVRYFPGEGDDARRRL